METLFDIGVKYPAGFIYYPDFLSSEEEQELLRGIAMLDFHAFNFHGYEAKRKVASFGYDYNFEGNKLSKGKDIPTFFDPLIEKVAKFIAIEKNAFSELLVTEYPVGSVINWHRDAFPFEIIAGISLHADCTFRLRPFDKAKQGRGSIVSIPVKCRSLYIIQDDARMNWQHSIAPVKQVRYSITLRTLKKK